MSAVRAWDIMLWHSAKIYVAVTEKDYHNFLTNTIGAPQHGIDQWMDGSGQACTHYLCNKKGDRYILVCFDLKQLNTKTKLIPVIIHEAVHVWQDYEKTVGMKDCHEVEAYCIQHIYENIFVALNAAIAAKKGKAKSSRAKLKAQRKTSVRVRKRKPIRKARNSR